MLSAILGTILSAMFSNTYQLKSNDTTLQCSIYMTFAAILKQNGMP